MNVPYSYNFKMKWGKSRVPSNISWLKIQGEVDESFEKTFYMPDVNSPCLFLFSHSIQVCICIHMLVGICIFILNPPLKRELIGVERIEHIILLIRSHLIGGNSKIFILWEINKNIFCIITFLDKWNKRKEFLFCCLKRQAKFSLRNI